MQTEFPGALQGGTRARETDLGSPSGRVCSRPREHTGPGSVAGQALEGLEEDEL